MDIGFGEAVLLFGGLLAVVAALSGLMRGTVLSASVLSVALGIALAAAGVVDVDATRPGDRRADRAGADPHPLLRRDVRRARAAAPPLEPGGALADDRDADHDGAAGAGGEGALPATSAGPRRSCSARCSAPTDPVVTSAVVTSRLVPSAVRHTLNLESGLNDGLALPFVLFFLVLASPGGDAGHRSGEAGRRGGCSAPPIGIGLGVLGGRLHHHLPGRRHHRLATRASTRSASPSSPSASPT